MDNNKIVKISVLLKIGLTAGILALIANFILYKESAWGSVLSNFIYFVALTQGTIIIAIAIRAASGHWSARFFRLGQSVCLAFFPFAAILMLAVLFLGHNSIHFWAAHPEESAWFNPAGFVIRNLALFGLFYLIAYRIFKTSLLQDTEVKPAAYHKITVNSFLLIGVFFLEMTVFSWDMSMTLNHGYMDSIYPFRFIGVALFGGLALNLLLMAIGRKYLNLAKNYPKMLFEKAGTLLFALSIVWFYTWWSQFFPVWYAHIPEKTVPQFYAYQVFRPEYLSMMIFSWFIPWFAMLFHRTRNTVGGLTVVSVVILIGHWIQRYIETVPAMQKYADVKAIFILSPLNVLFALGLICGFILVLSRMLRKYPAIVPLPEIDPEMEKDLLIAQPRGWN